jgi:hypothetical protein
MKVTILVNDKIRSTYYSDRQLLADIVLDLIRIVDSVFNTKQFKILRMEPSNKPHYAL